MEIRDGMGCGFGFTNERIGKNVNCHRYIVLRTDLHTIADTVGRTLVLLRRLLVSLRWRLRRFGDGRRRIGDGRRRIEVCRTIHSFYWGISKVKGLEP